MSDEEDEEVVDPKVATGEKCANSSKCSRLLVHYEECAERIEKKGSGQCTGQFMDYVQCVDQCSKSEVFAALK